MFCNCNERRLTQTKFRSLPHLKVDMGEALRDVNDFISKQVLLINLLQLVILVITVIFSGPMALRSEKRLAECI
jgi:hypothetical protein